MPRVTIDIDGPRGTWRAVEGANDGSRGNENAGELIGVGAGGYDRDCGGYGLDQSAVSTDDRDTRTGE